MKSNHIGRTFNTHRYTLWRDSVERDDGTIIPDDIVISMGEHGAMQTNPVHDRRETLKVLTSNDRMSKLAEHNMAEIRRAMEESGKWEKRLKDSPLGKTQQDFVAYYTEVIALFTKWRITYGIPLPH